MEAQKYGRVPRQVIEESMIVRENFLLPLLDHRFQLVDMDIRWRGEQPFDQLDDSHRNSSVPNRCKYFEIVLDHRQRTHLTDRK